MSTEIGFDPDDIGTNHSGGPSFNDVVARRASRRTVLAGSMLGAAAFMTLGTAEAAVAGRANRGPLLGFDPAPLSTADAVVVPKG